MKNRLIGSAPSLEKLLEGARKFFCSDAIRFEMQGDRWTVINSKGPIDGVSVVKKGGRYRMEMTA